MLGRLAHTHKTVQYSSICWKIHEVMCSFLCNRTLRSLFSSFSSNFQILIQYSFKRTEQSSVILPTHHSFQFMEWFFCTRSWKKCPRWLSYSLAVKYGTLRRLVKAFGTVRRHLIILCIDGCYFVPPYLVLIIAVFISCTCFCFILCILSRRKFTQKFYVSESSCSA